MSLFYQVCDETCSQRCLAINISLQDFSVQYNFEE